MTSSTSRGRRGAGMTLVEVLAGLALLGSTLSAALIARGQYLHQLRRAELKLQAVSAAETLLARRWADERPFQPGEGVLAGPTPFRWTMRPVENNDVSALGCGVVRLEVYEPQHLSRRPLDEPIIAVDLLVSRIGKAVAP